MLALRWQDVRGNVVRLRTSKNGQARAVPLSPRALEALAALPRVPIQVLPISPHTLDKQWRRACREAEVVGVRVHDLRHTAVTRLLERGLEPFEAMAVSGHRDPRMLQRYTHLSTAKIAAKLAA
jgi:integrase